MAVERVLLASPRGFCAGVEMAIKALTWMVRVFDGPIYCYHEIVHNQLVVDQFRRLGVVFVDQVEDVPVGAPLMLSAHGTAPEVVARAGERGLVVDAACPLVTKVHHELKVRAERGYDIVYVGHEGHDEAVGTMAVAPESVHLVQSISDLDSLPANGRPLALLAQTTLSHDEWSDILDETKARHPDVWLPAQSDLCFATTNRQAALRALAKRTDAIVVIGSENSSNTVALTKVATNLGVSRVMRINTADELPTDLTGEVGVTAGASAPEQLVREVIDALNPSAGVELIQVTDEDEYFPLPRSLRRLSKAVATAVGLGLALPRPGDPSADDRIVTAGSVLADLPA